MKKILLQLSAIVFLLSFFIFTDYSLYSHFIKRLINPFGKEMQAKSIELAEYLPFSPSSKIVKIPANEEEKFSENEKLPVLDGATALYPLYSAFFYSLYPESACTFDGKDFQPESKLQKRNTGGAFKAIVDKSADIIFCAQPSKKQLQFAKENNIELSLTPLGYEAFVFLVNKSNPVDNLSLSQIKDIYSGKISNWNEVGGDNSKISAITRPEGSGSQTAMLSIMKEIPIKPKNDIFSGRTLGYSFRYYVEDIVSSGNIKMLSLNGLAPTLENIKSKKYPITSNFYLICRKEDLNKKEIQKVIRFALSESGQKIIEETGYTGL